MAEEAGSRLQRCQEAVSEFHPCVRCDPNVRAAFPNATIEFTWPYTPLRDSVSKIGRDAKTKVIRALRGE